MIKDYEIVAPLRSGGMALLYLARRRGVGGFNRLVVLKLVHPDLLEDAAMTSLFLAEARISAHVAHPNVVHVEEVGRVGDSYFIAMEYVHGVSLAELVQSLSERRLRMSPKLCVWVAAQVAEALHAVHEARGENDLPLHIVHRDVSPQNVLIGHTGHVKLIDFGIAKSQPNDDPIGYCRAVLGKLGYMAPEQLRLERVDRRTDVYALGVLLWEMLSARSLFRCQRVDDEHDWATRELPPAPSEFSPTKNAALDRVVLKALAIEPNDRYESAFAFRAALLRAEPTTVQIDAPRFAALMQTLLGEELARRQACLPSELSAQFQCEAVTTAKALDFEELTAEIVSIDGEGEDDEPVTVADSPAALRDSVVALLPRYEGAPGASSLSAVAVHSAMAPPFTGAPGAAISLLRDSWPATQTFNSPLGGGASPTFLSLEREIVTEPAPRSDALPIDHAGLARARKARFLAIGVVCTALGMLVGSRLRSSEAASAAASTGFVPGLPAGPAAVGGEGRVRAHSLLPTRNSDVEQERAPRAQDAPAALDERADTTTRSRSSQREPTTKSTAGVSQRSSPSARGATARASRLAKLASSSKAKASASARNRQRAR